jgi:hypothetical protein
MIISEAVNDENKLTHLEHLEDHVVNDGDKGFAHAFHNLKDVHDLLSGKHNNTTVTTKYDGSPSIVFGHHPENGKFFVASKSAFNKTPKLNYTPDDIEQNHGHAPGLVNKLNDALKHLKKVAPKEGVYQGDVMYSKHDVIDDGEKFHFKPNTITYSAKKDSEEGNKIKHAKFGVVVHTAYKGSTLNDLKAQYNADTSHFGHHDDVHLISPSHDFSNNKYSEKEKDLFNSHLNSATKAFNSAHKDFHTAVHPYTEHLKTYINSTVRDQTKPSVEGFKNHLQNRFVKDITKLKTGSAIERKNKEMKSHLSQISTNKPHFKSALDIHHHLQQAKNVLVNALSRNTKFEHSIAGQKAKPEGFVSVRNNRPTKLVDRSEFSRANFLLARDR